MGTLDGMMIGFWAALAPGNLLMCAIGVLTGMLVGVLPGIGTATAVSLLIPITFYGTPVGSLIMLAGIYYGAQYGGTITSVLVNIPGEASTVVTTLDGHPMAKKGRAGAALTVATVGSFFAGCVATALIVLFVTPLSEVALYIAPADYSALFVLGLALAVTIAQGPVLPAVGMAVLGTLLGLVGSDMETGAQRLTFGILELYDGIDMIAVVMGMFGLSEILIALEQKRGGMIKTIGSLRPTRQEWRRAIPAIFRGTALGSLLGIIPGGGSIISSFASYAAEKSLSKNPEQFGKGAIEGVAGPESANNAGAQTSMIPLLALGIPGNVVMALMFGALMIHGIVPGPGLSTKEPELFWGFIMSMWVGNLMLLVLNVPLVGMWVKLIEVPYWSLFPPIVLFMAIGAYSLSNTAFDGIVMTIFGVFGYVCIKLRLEPVPMILGLFLGPLLEENLRRAMLMSRGDPTIFFTRPVSGSIIAFGLIAVAGILYLRRKT